MIIFSIIVLSYNNSLQQILLTVKSILFQSLKNFEIIFADDASNRYWGKEIKKYLEKYDFNNYFFSPSDKNLGTVKNILRSLQHARGKYVKCIGAGDILYNENVLSDVYERMEITNAKWLAGELASYSIQDNIIKKSYFHAPLDEEPFKKRNYSKIKKNVIVYADYISGASMFFNTIYITKYLKKIKDIVIYTEDLVQVLMLLNNEKIIFISSPLIGYEFGTGISTSTKKKPKLNLDNIKLDKYISLNYSDLFASKRIRRNNILKRSNNLQKILYFCFKEPKRAILRCLRNSIICCPKHNLGFLDDYGFIREFNLKKK